MKLHEGHPPEELNIGADNTPKETKNQWFSAGHTFSLWAQGNVCYLPLDRIVQGQATSSVLGSLRLGCLIEP